MDDIDLVACDNELGDSHSMGTGREIRLYRDKILNFDLCSSFNHMNSVMILRLL